MLASVRFIPSNRDLIWAGYAGIRAKPRLFFLSVIFFVGLPWAAVALAIGFATPAKPIHWLPIAALAVLPVLAFSAFALIPVFLFGNAPSLKGAHHYDFDDSGMRFTGPGFDNRMEWTLVSNCLETRAGFLFMSASQPMIFIPKRAIDRDFRRQLMALLDQKQIAFLQKSFFS